MWCIYVFEAGYRGVDWYPSLSGGKPIWFTSHAKAVEMAAWTRAATGYRTCLRYYGEL